MEMENEKNAPLSPVQEETVKCECACDCEGEKPAETPACSETCDCKEMEKECDCQCECSCCDEEKEEPAGEEEAPRKERRERPQIPVTQEMIDSSKATLEKMLDYLGLEGTVKAEGRTSKINLYVSSSDAGRIIGRKGQTLESLQLILNKLMQKTNADFPKVYIDLDGYSSGRTERNMDRRERGSRGERGPRRNSDRRRSDRGDEDFSSEDDNLRQQAIDASKEVRRWGEPVTLPPMNSHDRRIIHIALENDADIITESSGEGAMKSVTIMLKK